VTPPKLPKSNHSPFIGNTHNIARVEPLPPPLNTNSQFLSDDLDMLEELKARAKAALLKEGDTRNQESLLKAVSKESNIGDTVEMLKNSMSNMKQKRRHESKEESREKKLLSNEDSGSNQEFEDSEDQPLADILKATNDSANKKQPPSKRLRTKSITLDNDTDNDVTPINDNDISSSTKVNKNPFDDEEEDEEEEEDRNKINEVQDNNTGDDEM
jgi:hypothetical protein